MQHNAELYRGPSLVATHRKSGNSKGLTDISSPCSSFGTIPELIEHVDDFSGNGSSTYRSSAQDKVGTMHRSSQSVVPRVMGNEDPAGNGTDRFLNLKNFGGMPVGPIAC